MAIVVVTTGCLLWLCSSDYSAGKGFRGRFGGYIHFYDVTPFAYTYVFASIKVHAGNIDRPY